MKKPKKYGKPKTTRKATNKKSSSRNVKSTIKTQSPNSGRKSKQKSIRKNKGVFRQKPSGKTKGRTIETAKQLRATHEHGESSVDFTFGSLRSPDKKLEAIDKSKVFDDAINKRLYSSKNYKGKGKGYKEPRAVVVTITGKRGTGKGAKKATKTEVSPVDFIVNRKNVKGYVRGIVERMKDDYTAWLEMGGDEGEEVDSDNPYADFNPNTINKISVRFIY